MPGPIALPNPEQLKHVVASHISKSATGTGALPFTTGPGAVAGIATGAKGNLSSPFTKQMTQTTQVDMGVDFGNLSSHYSGGDPILAIGDCYLHPGGITSNWYIGQPGMFFELTDKSAGYWGWYVAEGIVPAMTPGSSLIKGGTQVARFAQGTGSIEIGWAASSTQTAAQANGHSGQVPSPEGTSFLSFLNSVGALVGTSAAKSVSQAAAGTNSSLF